MNLKVFTIQSHENEKVDERSSGERLSAEFKPMQWQQLVLVTKGPGGNTLYSRQVRLAD